MHSSPFASAESIFKSWMCIFRTRYLLLQRVQHDLQCGALGAKAFPADVNVLSTASLMAYLSKC